MIDCWLPWSNPRCSQPASFPPCAAFPPPTVPSPEPMSMMEPETLVGLLLLLGPGGVREGVWEGCVV